MLPVVRTQVLVADGPVGADSVVRGCWRSRRDGSAGRIRRSGPSIRPRRDPSCWRRGEPGRHPEMTRGSVQYRWCDPASSLTQSRSGSQNGPASKATTFHPRRASRWVRTPPPAPQPTTTRSTSSSGSEPRISLRKRWLVRDPSLGSSHADALRARTWFTAVISPGGSPGLRSDGRAPGRRPWPCRACPCSTRSAQGPDRRVTLRRLPGLTFADAEVLVSPRVGGPAESDLVPGPRVRVVGIADVAHPQLEQAVGRKAVPVALGAPYAFDELLLRREVQFGEGSPERASGVSLKGLDGTGPCLPVLGHRVVAVAVAATLE